MAMVRGKDMMASVMNMRMTMMVVKTMMMTMKMMMVVYGYSYDNEEDCKDDYVETEQQIMNVGGLCIYAASRHHSVCACNYAHIYVLQLSIVKYRGKLVIWGHFRKSQ